MKFPPSIHHIMCIHRAFVLNHELTIYKIDHKWLFTSLLSHTPLLVFKINTFDNYHSLKMDVDATTLNSFLEQAKFHTKNCQSARRNRSFNLISIQGLNTNV